MAKFLFAFDVVREINASVISEKRQSKLRDELNDIIGGQRIAETTRYSDDLYFYYDEDDYEFIDISRCTCREVKDLIFDFLKDNPDFSVKDLKHIRMAISKVPNSSNIEIINPEKTS